MKKLKKNMKKYNVWLKKIERKKYVLKNFSYDKVIK